MTIDDQAEALLARARVALDLLITGADDGPDLTERVLSDLRLALAGTADGRTVGPLIAALEKARAAYARRGPLPRLTVDAGLLTLGPRPGSKGITSLRSHGITHLLTVLADSEGALDIRDAATRAGVAWISLPLGSAQPPGDDRLPEIRDVYQQMAKVHRDGGGVYVHCAAGIHRTGMIAYGYLRSRGLTAHQARTALVEMRPKTADNVGEHRLAWGDRFAR